MIENRRLVIILDYTDCDVVQLIHTEIGAEERDAMVHRTKLGKGDVHHDYNAVHDDFHKLACTAGPIAQPIDRGPCRVLVNNSWCCQLRTNQPLNVKLTCAPTVDAMAAVLLY